MGGEPFYMKQFRNFAKMLIEDKTSQRIAMTLSTNGTVANKDLLESMATNFKDLAFSVSIDGVEDRFEYLRHPGKWDEVKDNLDYIPPYGKGSLYVRPIVWGTAPAIGVRAVSEYTIVVFVSPVGSYFKDGIKPLNLKVETDYHRAAARGIGNAKAIGNYSASLYPLTKAKKEGYDEVIYLDSVDGERIEELGSANLFIC